LKKCRLITLKNQSEKRNSKKKVYKTQKLLQSGYNYCDTDYTWRIIQLDGGVIHVGDKIKNTGRVTTFVIIPRYKFNKFVIKGDTSFSIKDR